MPNPDEKETVKPAIFLIVCLGVALFMFLGAIGVGVLAMQAGRNAPTTDAPSSTSGP